MFRHVFSFFLSLAGVLSLSGIVVLLLFGGKKIPELMRGLGRGVREFNDARDSVAKEFKEGMKDGDKEKIKIEDKTKSS